MLHLRLVVSNRNAMKFSFVNRESDERRDAYFLDNRGSSKLFWFVGFWVLAPCSHGIA